MASTYVYSYDKDKIWQMANTKVKDTSLREILKIKNNPLEPVNIVIIPNPDTFLDIKIGPEEFYKYYQNLTLTKEEQKQCLEEINTQLCDHCLISCDFQYCNKCNLIYNPPSYMIYTILKKNEPINSCILELELQFNLNSNSNNNDNKNNGSSFIQNSNKNNNNSDSDSNPEQYIVLSDLTKKQKLKWFNDNNEDIMLKYTHNTDTRFNLRYPEKDVIKLELYLCTCIDLKVALKILATIMVQLISRNSLVKREINIRKGIIDIRYVENIIAILQNDSKKIYIIEQNKKIAQAIFLPLVKIAQLVSVRKREELEITTREIKGFGSTDKIDISVNMTEKKIKKILSAPTRTIETDKLEKSRPTTTYAA
ncbi:hypothetical protein G9A89_010353 [Geosiphon pyriformis]|nr:hypothetical protein G9A89_010353 [Geosiphon pyriformis]